MAKIILFGEYFFAICHRFLKFLGKAPLQLIVKVGLYLLSLSSLHAVTCLLGLELRYWAAFEQFTRSDSLAFSTICKLLDNLIVGKVAIVLSTTVSEFHLSQS